MPELQFKGKEFVYNHHLTVPYRPLVPDAGKSVGEPSLLGNLIIHGDNLHALKALLPMYAGKVDCIFIDPPYNTGNEGWSYNDNVNSPMMKEWLSSNPINAEDMLRHDKWCAMMWPRLTLLKELLSESGSIWITLDDNEVHHARNLLDEIFGDDHCIGQLAWQKRTSRENRAVLSPSIDHLIAYSKCSTKLWRLVRNLLEPGDEGYSNPDQDSRGDWKSIPFSAQGFRKNQVYKITSPTGKVFDPPKGRCWGATEPEFESLKHQGLVYWPKDGDGRPRIKQFPKNAKGLVPETLWLAREVGDTEDSKKQLLEIFSDRDEIDFHAPKPPQLIERILKISTEKDSVVLDSFAGTGTTAHAVLLANKDDSGTRRFVLVELEDFANTLTAERVRRVIGGYKFVGTQKEELLRDSLTWTKLNNAEKLLKKVVRLEELSAANYNNIGKVVKDGELVVTGENTVTERTEGLGGEFTYCTLGAELNVDKILTGESLPDYLSVGAWLFHTATGEAFDASKAKAKDWYLGESAAFHVWLVYRQELDFLKSADAALTLALAEKIAKAKTAGKKHLVFAPAKYVPNTKLLPMGVEYAPLPFALYRIEKG
ncbi:site-specific DNA-methyltransferase [Acidicapsa acidisoli]|uniref:site-specific DNA-methyltransferase n=1 Tax=Acidicapsa acidisoli TaxID=1615681 RepID=UPI0021DF9A8C|nr:site-specific DNA-methyltransferase [Acidicapsa acidisoli]